MMLQDFFINQQAGGVYRMGGKPYAVVGLGELIWDLLPEGRRLGGAPTNFAYVARLLGDESFVASRVGRDELGREALEFLDGAGISTRYVQFDETHPTGTVGVRVDERGEAHFSVNRNSAWDYLEWTEGWKDLAARADAVCFGTLGQREARARAVINSFLRHTRADALRVFDVNLRHSFFDARVLAASLELASVVKLNGHELPLLASMLKTGGGGDEREVAARLLRMFGLELVAVTRGPRGSLLVSRAGAHEHPGFRVKVADTIGAGDAFVAALVHKLLRGASLEEMGEAANRAGAWVATRAGATPSVEPGALRSLLEEIGKV